MLRFLFLFSLTALFLLSCSQTEKVGEAKSPVNTLKEGKTKVCNDETLLAKGKGIRITLADYKYTLTLLTPKAKEFFKSHPEDLLKRMINRRLVLLYIKEKGLASKYGLDKEMEDFKEDYLSRLFVSREAQRRVGKITQEEIVKRFKELFPNKDPSKMNSADKEFIENELKVKKYDEAVSSIYKEVVKRIKFKEEKGTLVASCCGIEVKGKAGKNGKLEKEKLKEKLVRKYFYEKALEKGYDKEPSFKRMFTEYFAGKAIELFRKELSQGIKVSDEEMRRFYEENKEKFKMPPRVKAIVLYFKDRKKAQEAKELLEKGKSWQEVAHRFGQFNAKEKTYYKDFKDPIGVALFSLDSPKERKPIIISLSSSSYAVIYPVKYLPEKVISFKEARNFIALRLKREKLREAEKEKLKELWKEYQVKLLNLDCLRGV